jgi:hypothetical protein
VSYCHQTTYQLKRIFAVLVLTSILSFAVDMTFLQGALADSIEHAEGIAKENLMHDSLMVASLQASDENRSPLAIAGIGQELSNLAKHLISQLPGGTAEELPQDGKLPDSVANAVLQDAQRRSQLPVKELRIVKSEQRNWPDGCLGLAPPGTFCTQIVVPGWQVTVESGQQSFIYRSNNSGSLVKLEKG